MSHPKRVNDKFVTNVAVGLTGAGQSITLYDATDFAATTERIICTGTFTGEIDGPGTLSETVGFLLIHRRPATSTVASMSIAGVSQMWPDDSVILYQGLFKVSSDRNLQGIPLNVDVRGKRKLNPGDSIELMLKSEATNTQLQCAITIFAKFA